MNDLLDFVSFAKPNLGQSAAGRLLTFAFTSGEASYCRWDRWDRWCASCRGRRLSVGELKPLRFHLAVPLPGHALKRAVLAGLRKLGGPTLEELTAHRVETHGIDLELHDIGQLRQRTQKVLLCLVDKDGVAGINGLSFRYSPSA